MRATAALVPLKTAIKVFHLSESFIRLDYTTYVAVLVFVLF